MADIDLSEMAMASTGATLGTLSVSTRQKQSLLNMLTACTTTADPFEDSEDVWKVLIYDSTGRDIIAPLLSVAELRSAGVTLHMLLHSQRHPIPDVPAVYFVEPTSNNIARIASDAVKGIYASLWVNFTNAASREILETLAEGVAFTSRPNPLAGRISRVFDMYASFHALQHNLFSLSLEGIYASLNAVKVTNVEVEKIVAEIVDRLFCVLVTLGIVPFIRAQRGGPASMVANRLDRRIREHLKMANNAFIDGGGFAAAPTERPLLVLMDRAIDISVMLHHTWTYQALAHDVLGLRLNRVSIVPKDGDSAGTKRTFDLDSSDAFWAEHAGLPFPIVAEAVESALHAYQKEVAELNKSAGAVGGDGLDNSDANTADKLAAAISNIPGLAKKKRTIDLHTNIATAILDEIKERGLDGYFQVEEELLSQPGNFNVERILALINDVRGSVTDKLRLFLIFYMCMDSTSEGELERCVAALKHAGCKDLRAYRYLRNIKAFTRSMSATSVTPLSGSSSIGGAYAATVLDTLSQVASNVNKLILSTDKALAATRDMNALMDGKSEAEVSERYESFDPKVPKGGPIAGLTNRGFRNAVLFIVGPGNYIEFQNCQDHVCSRVVTEGKVRRMVPNGKTVIYGATELCTGAEFLEQLHANGEADVGDANGTAEGP